jgi:hypothetical protein
MINQEDIEAQDRPEHKPVVPIVWGATSSPPPPPPAERLLPPQSQDSSALDTHGPFVPYHPIRTRSSASVRSGDAFTALHMRAYITGLQIPTSTLDEFEYLLQLPTKGKSTTFDPLRALFRAIHDDSLSLVAVIHVSLRRIREGTLDEDLMQQRVTFWRSLLHRMNFSLAEFDQQLREFVHFAYESETHPFSPGQHVEIPSKKLARDTQQTLRSCMELIDKSSDSLRAEMQIVDSRRSIAEAESVSKLTELAFVFIPLSFVASLFSMQVHELEGGIPLYRFILVAISFVMVAYAIRLSIRSTSLIEYKNKTFNQIRDEAQLQYNEPIPTHTFLAWFGLVISHAIFRRTKNTIAAFAPLILVLAVIAAILSPIILLWLRNINKGFTAIMTVLLLLLDIGLVYPVIINTAGEFDFDPKATWNEMQRNRKINRKKREKAHRKRRQQKMGLDPESQGVDESSESSVSDMSDDSSS